MHILLGLGNPGPKYEKTRHNVGFALVDRLVEDAGQAGAWKAEGKSLTRRILLRDQPVLVVKPQTFMNLSGEAAQALCHFYKVPATNLVVVVDEIYLDTGVVRIRAKGGAGGHNGLKSLIEHCGEDFVRIRVGVGPCPPMMDKADFVLGRYGSTEADLLDPVFACFKDLVETGVSKGWEKAGSDFNRRIGT
ncbi:MAG TPA: aminoacyl-tRNA hydrolase [Fibrobacteria bacterium]|nr:aminoacyl-tRNA hydrolase [Fibrobacteria bacterium]